MTTTIKANELKAGDTFSRKGSDKSYTVVEVVPAHRAQYTFAVYAVSAQTGRNTTIAWPNNGSEATVELAK